MDDKRLFTVKLWFKKADSDFKTIENNLKSESPPTDAICFHAQQAIEKYITKTHDLVVLLTSVVEYIPELSNLEDELDEISRYGVEVRYPDIFYEPTLEEAKKSYDIAIKVKTIILKTVKI